MKITDINQIKIGDTIYDMDGEISHIININNDYMEPVIEIQNYPHSKWYILEVKCDKCGGLNYLKFTSNTSEKMICHHQIDLNINDDIKTITCGNKKYTEVSKKYTGIKHKSIITWSNLIKNYSL